MFIPICSEEIEHQEITQPFSRSHIISNSNKALSNSKALILFTATVLIIGSSSKLEEREMASHSSTLAWRVPWTKEPGRLQSMESLRVSTTEQLHFHFSFLLEKEMATYSSILAWRVPGMEELGGLLSMGSHRVGHD